MQPFDYFKPRDFDNAFQILNTPGKKIVPFAGGTDFIPMYRDGNWKVDAVVDVKELPGLRDIQETSEGLYVGAAARMSEIASSPVVNSHWNILAQSAGSVGSEQIRNRATIGGNIATASPCADTPPSLFVLDAIVILRNAEGERRLPIAEFFKWVRKTALQSGEIVIGLVMPKPVQGTVGTYVKLSRRKGSDLALVSIAARYSPTAAGSPWRISMGAVAPTILRATEAEQILAQGTDKVHLDLAAKAASEISKPISDVRSSETYRKLMVANMTKRAVRLTLEKMGIGG